MTMNLEGTPEQRAEAWRAATQFCAGTGWNPESLVLVAEMGLAYALHGPQVALNRVLGTSTSIPEQQSASPAQPSGDGAEGDWSSSAAQKLADEAYLATTRTHIKTILDDAERRGLTEDPIEIDGIRGPLRGFLNNRWNALKNSDLGL